MLLAPPVELAFLPAGRYGWQAHMLLALPVELAFLLAVHSAWRAGFVRSASKPPNRDFPHYTSSARCRAIISACLGRFASPNLRRFIFCQKIKNSDAFSKKQAKSEPPHRAARQPEPPHRAARQPEPPHIGRPRRQGRTGGDKATITESSSLA